MGVLSRNHVSEPVPRISQQPHGVLATLIRLPWLWAILLLASAVRFYGSTASAIWCDEGSSLLLSQFSLAGIWLHAARDVHLPLYFMLLHGWIALFADSLFSIRALSVLPGIATVFFGMCGCA